MQLFFQDQPRKERGRGEQKERIKTSMDSDGEWGGLRRCKHSRQTQTPVHGLGTLN